MARLARIEDRVDALEKKVDANEPKAGLGISVDDVPGGGGKSVSLFSQKNPPKPALNTTPFQLVDASSEGDPEIRVVYGAVNGTAPTGMSPGDDPTYVIPPVGTSGYVYLVLATDGDYIMNDLTIDVAATVPDDEENTGTGGTYYLQLGSYSIDGDGIMSLAQSVGGSLGFAWCGSPLFALS